MSEKTVEILSAVCFILLLIAFFEGRSLWSLYNGVTECLKGGDLSKLPARTMMTQSIFDARGGHRPIIEAQIDASELVMEA